MRTQSNEASAKRVRMSRTAWPRGRASINFLTNDVRSKGPTCKLCPSEEPKEAMADTGPDGRMVPTFMWRTQTPNIRDAMDLLSTRTLGASRSKKFSRCSN